MKQKRIVYLTFYFRPDLCAGSFRNTPLLEELAKLSKDINAIVDVYTTLPNRYSTYNVDALEYEQVENVNIYRIKLPVHKSGMVDQMKSFWHYFRHVNRMNKGKSADLVFASSSRLFTAYLGARLASRFKAPLYLDIRDIFVDSIKDVLQSKLARVGLLPFLKIIENVAFSRAKHINLISPGFTEYFEKYSRPNYSTFTNGIDEEFLSRDNKELSYIRNDNNVTILYAGNIGEGQGLYKIIPQAAKQLGSHFQFVVIGDGGAKHLLKKEMERLGVENIIIKEPVKRTELIEAYNSADYLFLHLNDYDAFKKVLPSKIFELATFNKPIIAGVGGYSASFISNEVSSSFVIPPCSVKALVDYLESGADLGAKIDRAEFMEKFKRSSINQEMAKSIVSYLN